MNGMYPTVKMKTAFHVLILLVKMFQGMKIKKPVHQVLGIKMKIISRYPLMMLILMHPLIQLMMLVKMFHVMEIKRSVQ